MVCRGGGNGGLFGEGEGDNIQAAAVRMMRRAQWFFMSLPIAWRWTVVGATVIAGRVEVRALSIRGEGKESGGQRQYCM